MGKVGLGRMGERAGAGGDWSSPWRNGRGFGGGVYDYRVVVSGCWGRHVVMGWDGVDGVGRCFDESVRVQVARAGVVA
ncbi:hypothetical protein FGB62_55g132 [Gracilaria domingensis]|nr:hypothetical protein FGB62_55g132 [Gracilaria domingensis]